MGHLSPEELLDLAEGTRARATAPHLDACERCRRELAACESVMADAAAFDVPEPSPLFWDQLSRRVHESVAAEGAPRRWSIGTWSWSAVTLSAAGALAALLLVVGFTLRGHQPRGVASNGSAAAVAAGAGDSDLLSDGASLGLVGELTADMDWDTAHSAGLVDDGSADHAVTHLSSAELRELDRLLKEALAKPGA